MHNKRISLKNSKYTINDFPDNINTYYMIIINPYYFYNNKEIQKTQRIIIIGLR